MSHGCSGTSPEKDGGVRTWRTTELPRQVFSFHRVDYGFPTTSHLTSNHFSHTCSVFLTTNIQFPRWEWVIGWVNLDIKLNLHQSAKDREADKASLCRTKPWSMNSSPRSRDGIWAEKSLNTCKLRYCLSF